MEYETKTYSIIVKPKENDIFCENATIVSIDDKGAGIFYTITQEGNTIQTDPDEWMYIVEAMATLRKVWS